MEMDRQDQHSGRLKEIHERLNSSYCQFQSSPDTSKDKQLKELNDHLHPSLGSFKSNSLAPLPKSLDQGKKNDDQGADDKNPRDSLVTLSTIICCLCYNIQIVTLNF